MIKQAASDAQIGRLCFSIHLHQEIHPFAPEPFASGNTNVGSGPGRVTGRADRKGRVSEPVARALEVAAAPLPETRGRPAWRRPRSGRCPPAPTSGVEPAEFMIDCRTLLLRRQFVPPFRAVLRPCRKYGLREAPVACYSFHGPSAYATTYACMRSHGCIDLDQIACIMRAVVACFAILDLLHNVAGQRVVFIHRLREITRPHICEPTASRFPVSTCSSPP